MLKMTEEVFARVEAALREYGPRFGVVGRAASVDSKIAKRVWEEGWPKLGLKSVKEKLLDELDELPPATLLSEQPPRLVAPQTAPREEAEAARGISQEQDEDVSDPTPEEEEEGSEEESEEDEPEEERGTGGGSSGFTTRTSQTKSSASTTRTSAPADSVDSIVEDEAQILLVTRKSAVLQASNSFRTIRLAGTVIGEIERRIKDENWLGKATMSDMRSLLKTGSELVQRGRDTVREAIELERAVRGLPDQKEPIDSEGELSDDDLVAELARIKHSIDASEQALDAGDPIHARERVDAEPQAEELDEPEDEGQDGGEPPDWLREELEDGGA